ncbi:MAG: hypothetical protein KGL39_50650 [Patescibacteria group bacterium]|nr:hypothetical protein [Patescibacteria group bacterium]
MGRKPKGFDAFDSLARKLVKVPRDELERQLAKRKKRKRRKKVVGHQAGATPMGVSNG